MSPSGVALSFFTTNCGLSTGLGIWKIFDKYCYSKKKALLSVEPPEACWYIQNASSKADIYLPSMERMSVCYTISSI